MTDLFQSAIQRILPHRYPFLLLDRVTEFEPGVRIRGLKHFTQNEAHLQGHFPLQPQIPGGILIEAVTQLGAILVLERPGMEDKIAMILQIPSAQMLRVVEPGETVEFEATVLKMKENLGELRGLARVGTEVVAEGQMRFAIASAKDVLPA
jgi:3-hydroxyacyl-[acyl-carrier-protein] dehydratase